jgi:aspartate kinase
MPIIVQKFGGTSVADIQRIQNVANIIKAEYNCGNKIVVVVSAMAGVTNSLISQCSQISNLDNISALREYDAAVASGEIITSALLALELQKSGINARSMQGWQVPIKTDNIHGNAQAIEVPSDRLSKMLEEKIVPVITGFQGITNDGSVTTLGKGGSDTSAAIIAAALNADRCDIYTDVEGIYSADPRIVHDAHKIDFIDINELCVLCASGAKVLHPRAALAAKRYNLKLRILSSFNINSGTIAISGNSFMEHRKVTAITSNKNLLKIDINHGAKYLIDMCKTLSDNAIQIEQTNSIDSSRFYVIVNLSDKPKCLPILERLKNTHQEINYHLNTNISTVTIVGYGIKNDTSLTLKVMEILDQNKIKIISSYADDIKMSLLINDQDNEKVIKLLHEKLIKNN